MRKGISTNKNVRQILQCLRQNDFDFVFRYYCCGTRQKEKRLGLEEARAISTSGLSIAMVYEDGPLSPAYFSNLRGYRDGLNACCFAKELDQPVNSAIYFAVDYDAEPSDITGSISNYFRGVIDGMRYAGNNTTPYRIGVYGSGLVCRKIKELCPFVDFSWLAESTGWSEYNSYTAWNVKQRSPDNEICGLDTDDYEFNIARDEDFGSFMLT